MDFVPQAPVNAQTDRGVTPLHAAAHRGHLATAEVLLQWKADLHVTDARGATCLFAAVEGGNEEVRR